MGMPEIPDGKNRPNIDETIIDLLESIALEEMSIAHILNAEGEKLQALVKRFSCHELTFCELQTSCHSVNSMINSLIMKEWLLTSKLQTVLTIKPSHSFHEKNSRSHNCY